jgi:hypothetical protein
MSILSDCVRLAVRAGEQTAPVWVTRSILHLRFEFPFVVRILTHLLKPCQVPFDIMPAVPPLRNSSRTAGVTTTNVALLTDVSALLPTRLGRAEAPSQSDSRCPRFLRRFDQRGKNYSWRVRCVGAIVCHDALRRPGCHCPKGAVTGRKRREGWLSSKFRPAASSLAPGLLWDDANA